MVHKTYRAFLIPSAGDMLTTRPFKMAMDAYSSGMKDATRLLSHPNVMYVELVVAKHREAEPALSRLIRREELHG